jgi:predicted RNA-binding protein
MCLSTAYIKTSNKGDKIKEVMGNVALLEAEADGFLLTTLFGEQTFVAGRIKSIDFMQDHSIVFESADR